ncbi:hypothetical protein [Aquimarina algiphila]|uniref:hypothetical protein n=1 Tax=Aquimarina algiphila TaxID=2047982 RepID=UPI00232DED33|nr:hypothetical protein [Aquimarina algiphila]
MKKLLFLVLLSITISCSKDDGLVTNSDINNETDPINDSITYFTLKVNEFYIGEIVNSGYLIINDNEGDILAHTKIENDKEYIFKAKKGEEKESFTVSRFIYRDRKSSQVNFLSSFFNIKKGTIWNFEGSETNRSIANTKVIGKDTKILNLKIQNIDGYSTVGISSNNGSLSTSSSFTSNSIDYDPIVLQNKQNKFLITVHFELEKSKYFFIDNVQDQQEIIIDGSELKEFDSYIPINLPNDGNIYSKNLSANLTPEERFSTTWFSRIESEATSNFGVFENFYDFFIDVYTSNDAENYRYSYIQESPTLESLTIQPYSTDFKLINSSLMAFEFTSNQKHNTKSSRWSNRIDNFVDNKFRYDSWSFRSNELPYQTMPKLPKELLDLYPHFKLEDLVYEETSFSNGSTYESFFMSQNSIEDNNNTKFTESLTFKNPDYNKSLKNSEGFEEMIKELQNHHY